MTKKSITSSLKAFVISLAAMVMGGCADMYPDLARYEAQPKEPVVQQFSYGTDIHFAADMGALDADEAERLVSYLQRMSIGRYDRIALVVFETDAGVPLIANRRIRAVQDVLAAQGFHVNEVRRSSVSAESSTDRLRVLVDRYLVTQPGCPDWTKTATGSFDNQAHSNWGCATATNLGAMIAEPRDLLTGRDDHVSDGAHAIRSVQKYHDGETTEIDPQATNESM